MTIVRAVLAALVLTLGSAACSVEPDRPLARPEASPPSATPSPTAPRPTAPSPTTPPTAPASHADAVREWEARAGDHFTQSAAALAKVSESSSAEDEAGLRSGCQQLHDTNSVGLQEDLPTPDQKLTNELQRMIDDMNTATHACLRFALARSPIDAETYQEYLRRAVEHLQRAKMILTALKK